MRERERERGSQGQRAGLSGGERKREREVMAVLVAMIVVHTCTILTTAVFLFHKLMVQPHILSRPMTM